MLIYLEGVSLRAFTVKQLRDRLGDMGARMSDAHVAAFAEALTTGRPATLLIDDFRPGQRAMMASHVATRKRSGRNIPASEIRARQVAKLLQINESFVWKANRIYARALPGEIRAAEAGTIGVEGIYRKYKTGQPPTERAASRLQDLRLVRLLHDAVKNISQLPSARECVPIIRRHDRTAFYPQRLGPALKWLQEFAHAYQSNDENHRAA